MPATVHTMRAAFPWVVAALLALTPGCGDDSSPQARKELQPLPDRRMAVSAPVSTEEERTRRKRFWEIYRQATARRIDGDYAAALALFDSALTLQPDHLDALYYSGNAAFELGLFASAEQRWRRELAANDHSARAHAQLGVLYSSGLPGAPVDLERARAELLAAQALNRTETGPLLRLGEVALLQADLPAAHRWLAAAAKTHVRSVAAAYLRGYLAWLQADTSRAEVFLAQAVDLSRGGPAEISASAEGQTRRGHRPLLESGRIGVLAAFWEHLTEGGRTPASVEVEYTAFDHALVRLRRQMAGEAVGD